VQTSLSIKREQHLSSKEVKIKTKKGETLTRGGLEAMMNSLKTRFKRLVTKNNNGIILREEERVELDS
jgi:hypothetical protein